MSGHDALIEAGGRTGAGRGAGRDPACRAGGASVDAELAAPAAAARAAFGVRCFWNTPVLADPRADARLVAGQLRKHGGRRGWIAASGIDRVLRAVVGASDGVDRLPAGGADASRPQPLSE